MKTCTKCQEAKPLSAFGRQRRGSDALRARCKACMREVKREWKAANPERDRQHWQRWRAKQPPGTLPHQRAWYAAQEPDRLREARAEWKRANPEKAREINRLSYAKDLTRSRCRSREAFHRRRAGMRGGGVTPAFIADLVAQPCAYCGATENIEVDHIVPLARGGLHEPENLAPACRPCNRSKGTKLLWEWVAG